MKTKILAVLKRTPVLGTVLGLFAALAANIYSFALIEYECVNCPVSYGTPFVVAEMTGFQGEHRVHWDGVAGDVLVFVAAGILLVAAVRALTRKRRKLSWE